MATVSWELVPKAERARRDLRFDACEVHARTLQIALGGAPWERWAEAFSVKC